jgi:aspartate racemase
MKTIGILGGMGPASTIAYYRYITDRYYELYGNYAYPEIAVFSVDFQTIIDARYDRPDIVRDAIEALHRAGADFVVASCNSIHVVYDRIADDLPIPWVSIVDVLGEHVRKSGTTRVGLLGTALTMRQGFYQRGLAHYGVETIVPEEAEQQQVNAIIFAELVRGVMTEASKGVMLESVERLSRAGADAVVLGCTEIPLLIQQDDTTVPLFDTTTLHAQHALDLAMEAPIVGHT